MLLRQLEADGRITQHVDVQVPQKLEHRLIEQGGALRPFILSLTSRE